MNRPKAPGVAALRAIAIVAEGLGEEVLRELQKLVNPTVPSDVHEVRREVLVIAAAFKRLVGYVQNSRGEFSPPQLRAFAAIARGLAELAEAEEKPK